MNEKNYLIEFEYGGKSFQIHNLSHADFSKGKISDAVFMAYVIEEYISTQNLHKDGAIVSNARLFGKNGEPILKIEDFRNL